VVSLSAIVARRDVEAALVGARIAEFSIDIPSVSMVRSRHVIDGFRTALQQRLSELEAEERGAIHLFMAIPAALAIEFGAMLTMQHRHTYRAMTARKLVPSS
jgi:SMODS-associated and fused to various effectors sensor domain